MKMFADLWFWKGCAAVLVGMVQSIVAAAGSREGTRFMRRIRRVTKAMEFIRLVDA